MRYNQMGAGARLVFLSTLDKSRTLSEINKIWFNNTTQLYLEVYQKQFNKAIKAGFLVKTNNKYSANRKTFLDEALSQIKFNANEKKTKSYLEKYKGRINFFYTDLSYFTFPTYFNLDVIKTLLKNNFDNISHIDLKFLTTLPFFLRYLEEKDKSILSLFLDIMNLDDYYKFVTKYEFKNMYLLKEKKQIHKWVECINYITSSYFPQFIKEDMGAFKEVYESLKTLGGKR